MIAFLEKNRSVAMIITLSIAVFIFYMSSRTFPGIGSKGYLSYIYHFSVFFFFAGFFLIATTRGKLQVELFILTLAIAIVYGMSDELHQFFVPGRYPDILDVLTDSIGILSMGILYGGRCRVNGNKRGEMIS